MPPVTIASDDLAPFAEIDSVKAEAMIDDALALAARVAPCILGADFAYPDAAKAIIRGAILRWDDAGTGAIVQRGAGMFQETVDTKQTRRSMFWPSEITDLQRLCSETQESKAFSVDTVPDCGLSAHPPFCSLYFGGTCSCGVALAGYPIYEPW